jgi:hypothetical protein
MNVAVFRDIGALIGRPLVPLRSVAVLTLVSWIAKTSHDTALRDIKVMITKGVLKQEPSGGRSTSYRLVRP